LVLCCPLPPEPMAAITIRSLGGTVPEPAKTEAGTIQGSDATAAVVLTNSRRVVFLINGLLLAIQAGVGHPSMADLGRQPMCKAKLNLSNTESWVNRITICTL